MVKPLLNLTSAASNYVDEKDKTKDKGHFEQVEVPTHDELLLLKDSMVDMESDLTKYVNDISRMTAEKERVSVEMEMSARIQTSLLPQKLENYTGEHSFEIHSLIDPAKDVGGDFYDYYVIDDDHIGLTIADVSGKGVPAALFMTVTKTLLQMAGKMYGSPAEILGSVNRQLCYQNRETMFVTVFFGIYTISQKKLIYVNAGHEELAVYHKSEGKFVISREEHDLLVAINPDEEFTERTLLLDSGDKIFMFTDGVTDARNAQEEMFGENRMTDALNTLKDLPGDELIAKMRECISDFAGETPQFDDVTMLLLEVL
jgi:sigma-B regulation protein RsbU (phosphoserine phosphatase)